MRAVTWSDSPGRLRAWWTEVNWEQGNLVGTVGWDNEGKNHPTVGMVDWELECMRSEEGSLWRV